MHFPSTPEAGAQLFRPLFEQSSLGIAIEDLDGTLLLANPALCSMLGYRAEELCGMTCSEFDSEEELTLFQKLGTGEIDHYSLEKCYITKSGASVWGRVNVCRVRNEDTGAPLILAFVEDINQRKLAEEALRTSEERYRLLFERNLAGVAIGSSGGILLDCNGAWAQMLGYSSTDEVRGRRIEEFYYDPSRRGAFLEELSREHALTGEMRLRRKDGSPVWVLFNATLIGGAHGPAIVQATVIDITKRKLAEEALSGMAGKLIEAHERECTRVGRELHDDIGQRLALLAVELQQLKQAPPETALQVSSRMEDLWREAVDIANDVGALSYGLRSAKLEYLGLPAAMGGLCEEFAKRHQMEVEFTARDLPNPLPSHEVSISFFRVLQEALRNAAKHSGVRRFDVRLWGTADELHLTVTDSGAGFAPDVALNGRGLGLTNMMERLHMVEGELTIDSQPNRGTTIHARVALNSGRDLGRVEG